MDTGEIAFLAAYDLSFIENKGKQTIIANIIKRDGCKVDMKTAALLREYYENKKLTDELTEQILSGEKTRRPKNGSPNAFKIKLAVLNKYFNGGQSKTEIEDTIEKALSFYFSQNQN